MTEGLLQSNKKIRFLACIRDVAVERIIRPVCDSFGLELKTIENSEDALKELNNYYYSYIFCQAAALNQQGDFASSVRSIRGYERVPIFYLDQDKNMHELTSMLNEGADAVFGRHFHTEQLEAYINLFLRHDLQERFSEQEYMRKDLNLNEGQVVLCAKPGQVPEIPIKEISTEVIQVFSESELFNTLYSKNVWIVLIGTTARWALPLVGKLKNDKSFNLQLILLRNNNVLDADVVQFFNQGGDDITSIRKPSFILTRQFNSRIEREFYYKSKYLNALKTAAEKLPIRSEQNYQQLFKPFTIEAFHRPHEGTPGGDFYEVIHPGDDSRLIILGDVMGKMWGAWFFSIAYLSYIRSTIRLLAGRHLHDPAAILQSLNEVIFRDFKMAEVFTTLNVIKIYKGKRDIVLASASGLPALRIGSDGVLETRKPQGTILGLNEGSSFSNTTVHMEDGDALWLYTDGYLTEHEPEVEVGLVESLANSLMGKSLMNLDAVDDELEELKQGKFNDDRTIIRIRLDS